YAALRYFNASGAAEDGSIGEDHNPETHLIPLVLQVALGQRDEVLVFGEDYPTPHGTCIRDYIHVDDLRRAHIAPLEKLARPVAAARGRTEREGVDPSRRLAGQKRPGKGGPRRAGDPPVRAAAPSPHRQQLNWTPKHVGIDPIVASAWKWHQAHPKGYGD